MKYLIIIIVFITLLGCELIVDIDVPFEGKKITVNSFFTPDSVWHVQLNLNRHILNDEPAEEVADARVIIYEDDKILDTLSYFREGMYKSNETKPTVGKRYAIEVIKDNLQSIKSHSFVPSPVEILDVDLTEKASNHEMKTNLKLKIKDNGTEANFYEIFLWAGSEFYNYRTQKAGATLHPIPLESHDPIIAGENGSDVYFNRTLLIKDVLFNGELVELNFEANGISLTHTAIVQLFVRSLTEEMYKYKATANLQDETSGDPFAQPVNVFNNIENGFGIFAGYSQSVYEKSQPKPVIKSLSADRGSPGDTITILGENFNSEYGHAQFQGPEYPLPAQMIWVDDTRIQVIVPQGAATGKIVLYFGGRVAVTDLDFIVE